MTLVEFLRARLDEDERDATRESLFPTSLRRLGRPAREVDAMRRIVDLHAWYADAQFPDYGGGFATAVDYVLALLALPYADHPDYRDEWRPA